MVNYSGSQPFHQAFLWALQFRPRTLDKRFVATYSKYQGGEGQMQNKFEEWHVAWHDFGNSIIMLNVIYAE